MFSLRKINILAVQQKIAIPPYDGQEIVEIVSHSPGQPAQQSKPQQDAVKPAEKLSCLVQGGEHTQSHGKLVTFRQSDSTNQIFLATKLKLLRRVNGIYVFHWSQGRKTVSRSLRERACQSRVP